MITMTNEARRAALGLVGDGLSLETRALQAAIDAVGEAGGGELRLPPGRYRSGALLLRSGVDFIIEAGALLLASENRADYPLVQSRWEGRSRLVHAPLVSGRGLRGISLRGRGGIDGRGFSWWRALAAGELEYPRPRLIAFEDCEDILIEGLSLANSPSWTVNPVRCRRVSIRNLRISNPPDSPNTDGINPDSSSSVLIEGCSIASGDDCVAIKAGTETELPELRAPAEDIVIANCLFQAGHGGVVIGSEMSGGVRGVTVSNCTMRGTDRGIRIKSRRGRGGIVEDLRFSNLVMEGVKVPIALNLHYHCCGARGDAAVADLAARPVGPGTPLVRGLAVSGLTARGVSIAAAYLDGLAEAPAEGIVLRDILMEMEPSEIPEPPEMADIMEARSGAGFIVRDVRGLRLDGVELRGQRGSAFLFERCTAVSERGSPGFDPEIRY